MPPSTGRSHTTAASTTCQQTTPTGFPRTGPPTPEACGSTWPGRCRTAPSTRCVMRATVCTRPARARASGSRTRTRSCWSWCPGLASPGSTSARSWAVTTQLAVIDGRSSAWRASPRADGARRRKSSSWTLSTRGSGRAGGKFPPTWTRSTSSSSWTPSTGSRSPSPCPPATRRSAPRSGTSSCGRRCWRRPGGMTPARRAWAGSPRRTCSWWRGCSRPAQTTASSTATTWIGRV
mmetsp:Transcript_600/g.1676  ORF Transcript_600/g.1676 Transcript_600/m.1676 type:complete len:235 (+) Transcript_600:165-869(+)